MIKESTRILTLYCLFAIFSMLVNICSQLISIFLYQGIYMIEVSILIGTLMGLPLRYLLEKRYIFSYQSKNIRHDGELFILYVLMGIITTIIFWVTEYTFHKLFDNAFLRYLGGFIGLSIGFYIKYRLDKKFVFVKTNFRDLQR